MRSALVLLTLLGAAEAAPRRAKPGTELAAADLGWPEGTKSARVAKPTDVARAPDRGGTIGTLAAGTRVGWKRIVAGRSCAAWLELEPRGFACASKLEPSDEPPAAANPPAKIVEDTLAQTYLHVGAAGARAYATPDAIRRGGGKKLASWHFLQRTIKAVEFSKGTMFVKTIDGYVAATDLVVQPPSPWHGLELTASTPWPFAWAVADPKAPRALAVRAAPAKTAAQVRELAHRDRVPVLEEQAGFARIGANEWVALADLRIARSSKRPTGVKADERWIDVDLDQNVLVAYDGDKPVFATLVSTGFGSTPPSLHRIIRKDALRTLAMSGSVGSWNFPDVPFVLEFRKYYALHSVYWHDSFGTRRGHGCVNLSPRDARTLYDFTLPHVPDGWATATGDGTPVRIRNKANPDPRWTPWNAAPP